MHCIGQDGRGVYLENSEIPNGEGRCAGTAVVEASGKVLGWTWRGCDELRISKPTHHKSTATLTQTGLVT